VNASITTTAKDTIKILNAFNMRRDINKQQIPITNNKLTAKERDIVVDLLLNYSTKSGIYSCFCLLLGTWESVRLFIRQCCVRSPATVGQFLLLFLS